MADDSIPETPTAENKLEPTDSATTLVPKRFSFLPTLPSFPQNLSALFSPFGGSTSPASIADTAHAFETPVDEHDKVLLGAPVSQIGSIKWPSRGDLNLLEASQDHDSTSPDVAHQPPTVKGAYTTLPTASRDFPRLSLPTVLSRRPSEMQTLANGSSRQDDHDNASGDDEGRPYSPVDRRIASGPFEGRQSSASFGGMLQPSLQGDVSRSRQASLTSDPATRRSSLAQSSVAEPSAQDTLRQPAVPRLITSECGPDAHSIGHGPPPAPKKAFLQRLGIRSVSNKLKSSGKHPGHPTHAQVGNGNGNGSVDSNHLLGSPMHIARTFSRTSITSFSTATSRTASTPAKPKCIKTKFKNKPDRDFKHLFLAQTISLESLSVAPSQLADTIDPHVQPPPDSARGSVASDTVDSSHRSSDSSTSSSDVIGSHILDQPISGMSQTQNKTGRKKRPAVWTMSFSADGKYLATAGHDGIVRVWQVVSSSPGAATEQDTEGMPETNRRWSKSFAATPAPVEPFAIFDTKPVREYVGHTADVLDLCWSKNDFLLSASMDKSVRLWHISRSECLSIFHHSDFVTSVAFHPRDDRYFLSGSLDCHLRLWNVPYKSLHAFQEVDKLITAVAFSTDGKQAICGTYLGNTALFNVEDFSFISSFSAASSRGKNSKGKKITGIKAIQSSNPGKDRLLITTNDSRVRLYSTVDESMDAKYSGHENTSSQIRAEISSDARFIICGSEDGECHIWDSGISQGHDVSGWLLGKKAKPGSETFSVTSTTATCCLFAPESTKDLLAQARDPLLTTPASLRAMSSRNSAAISKRQTLLSRLSTNTSTLSSSESSTVDEEAERTATITNATIVCADQNGCIRVYRNSELPLEKVVSRSSASHSRAYNGSKARVA